MREVDKYNESALGGSGITIRDYKREERDGAIIIKYVHVDHAAGAATGAAYGVTAFFLLGPLIGAAIGAAAGYSTDKCHIFDARTGELIGENQDQASEKLNQKGCQLFQEGNYAEARKYHDNANRICSSDYQNAQKFKNDRAKADTEIRAKNLNDQGDSLFKQRNYKEAQIKYREAYNVSQVSNQYNKYASNRDKAEIELRARDLNDQGDNLFKQGNYNEAQTRYREAYDISQVGNERHIYAVNRDRAQMMNTLSKLDTLWNEAWVAENDIENDRSSEAKEIFKKILSESMDNLKTFPDNLRLKHYEMVASLKIEGNELFNQGLQFQQNGIQILKEAQVLKQQQKYKLANLKFKEAKDKFIAAEENFEKGSKVDQRFLSCIEFVKVQLKDVMFSMQITDKQILSRQMCDLDINISNDDRSDGDFSQPDITDQKQNILISAVSPAY